MGSPPGCAMANFFLGLLETLIFTDRMLCYPKLYVRYIDDVLPFLMMSTRVRLLNILNKDGSTVRCGTLVRHDTPQFLLKTTLVRYSLLVRYGYGILDTLFECAY